MSRDSSINSTSNPITPESWKNLLLMADYQKGFLALSTGEKKIEVLNPKNAADMEKKGYRKLSLQEIFKTSQSQINRRLDDNQAKQRNTRLAIFKFTAKRIHDESEKLQKYADKVNSTSVNVLKWILAISVIFSPIAFILNHVQNAANKSLKDTHKLQEELTKTYLKSITLEDIKPEEFTEIVKNTLKPLVPLNPNYTENAKDVFISLLKGEQVDLKPFLLRGKKPLNIPEIIAKDLPRYQLFQVNNKIVYSNKADSKAHDDPANAYREVLDLFEEDESNASLTNATLVATTQASMPHILKALTFKGENGEFTIPVTIPENPNLIEISLKDNIVKISRKEILQNMFIESSHSAPEFREMFYAIQNFEVPREELKEALKTQDMSKLVHLKAEVLISDFLPDEVKKNLDLLEKPLFKL